MILLAALLLQPAQPMPARAAAPPLKPIESTLAIETFRRICWTAFRDPADFHAAIIDAPIPLALTPKRDAAAPGEVYRSDEAALTYVAADDLPPGIPPRQCILRVRLSGAPDQLTLAARIAAALALPSGRTRATPAQAATEWTVAGDDGRTARLIALTRPATGGGVELRLTALLLAAP